MASDLRHRHASRLEPRDQRLEFIGLDAQMVHGSLPDVFRRLRI
jgi:erythromycin esterase-like protein